MSVIKTKHKVIGGSIAVAALFSAYFGYQGYHSVAPVVKTASLSTLQESKPLTAAPRTRFQPPEVASQVLAQLSERGQPSVPSEVKALLPGLTAPVSNWKNYKPQKITIAPYSDTPIEFEMTSVREENGRTLWTGRNALQGAFLTTVATADNWQATLVIPPVGAFDVNISGQNVTMLERNAVDERCGVKVAMGRDVAPVDLTAPAATAATPTAGADTINTVDVLYFYDADTLAKVGTQSAFDSRMMLNIESANAALVNSQITNLQWRFLASYQIPSYTATNDMADDLNEITGYSNGQIVPNTVSSFVSDKAALHGADQSVLYVGGTRNDAGIAWISSGTSPRTLNLAFHTAVVEWSTSFSVMAHELSHNFGCHHDRQTENAPDGDGHYYYGYRFNDARGNDTGTIMSYAAFRLPYFSNPALTVSGFTLGVADDQPKAADNARVLRDAAADMAASRATVNLPSITTQPQSATLTVGQNFSLSVTATGANLTYQWSFNGTAISGAISSTFTKTSAGTSDSGSYTVAVSNIAGSVTSNAATVTVNPAASSSAGSTTTTTTTSSSASSAGSSGGGGGGGGGGSINGIFALMGGLLSLLRWRFKNQK